MGSEMCIRDSGYSGTEALQAVKKVEITEGMDSEAVLKAALKHMF